MALKEAKIITVTGVNGGSGKTTTALNLAGIFYKQGLKTIIIDLDLNGGDVSYLLDLKETSDMFKMTEDISNNKFTNIMDYVLNYNDKIDVISATKDPRYSTKISPNSLKNVIANCKNIYDVILIDTSKEFNALNTTVFDLSDEILYLVENKSSSLKNMRTVTTILKEMDFKKYKTVLNESISTNKTYFSKNEIKNIIKTNIDYVIPSSFNIKDYEKYTLKGEILTLNKEINKKYKKEIKKLQMIAISLVGNKKGAK